MRSNIKPENRRLLEAIEYIDEDIVLGVLAGLKDPVENAVHGEYKKPSPFKYWRQFTALAACLLLLSAAFPVLNYAVQRFGIGTWEGNAGAGTEELESIDSPYERSVYAYPEGMSAEEIYADVLKGGWIVQDSDFSVNFDAGGDIWEEFLISIEKKIPITVLFAEFPPNNPGVRLYEIRYDGETYTITRQWRNQTSILAIEIKDFKYFLQSSSMSTPYFFANHHDADPTKLKNEIYSYDIEAFFLVIHAP